MKFNSDRSIFVAMNDYANSGHEAIVDPALSRAEIVRRICKREFGFEHIVSVFEFNAAEGWSRDVTADILAEAELAELAA